MQSKSVCHEFNDSSLHFVSLKQTDHSNTEDTDINTTKIVSLLNRFSFIQPLTEPCPVGRDGQVEHSYSGLQQLLVPCQIPLHAQNHHCVDQQEQD